MSTERLTLTVEEAADLLGISRALAYNLAKKGDLPCVRLGRRLIVPRQALDRLLTIGVTSSELRSREGDPS